MNFVESCFCEFHTLLKTERQMWTLFGEKYQTTNTLTRVFQMGVGIIDSIDTTLDFHGGNLRVTYLIMMWWHLMGQGNLEVGTFAH